MITEIPAAFHPADFLATLGLGRTVVLVRAKQVIFSQGDEADAIFYLRKGTAKLNVVSSSGKEATITLLRAGDFLGEEAVAVVTGVRQATASAVTDCTTLRIERKEMKQVLQNEPEFSNLFVEFLLARSMHTQANLVDQLCISSEQRLARILLSMAALGKPGRPDQFIPRISQEALASMVGTTRSRINFFMNRFRKLGFITYNSRIHVNQPLLNLFLVDQLAARSLAPVPIPGLEEELAALDDSAA